MVELNLYIWVGIPENYASGTTYIIAHSLNEARSIAWLNFSSQSDRQKNQPNSTVQSLDVTGGYCYIANPEAMPYETIPWDRVHNEIAKETEFLTRTGSRDDEPELNVMIRDPDHVISLIAGISIIDRGYDG